MFNWTTPFSPPILLINTTMSFEPKLAVVEALFLRLKTSRCWAELLHWTWQWISQQCGQQEEKIGHILWECPLARNVWALVRGRIQKASSSTASFFLRTRSMMERLSRQEFNLWAMITSLCGRYGLHETVSTSSTHSPIQWRFLSKQRTWWGNTRNLLKIWCEGRKLDASFSFIAKAVGETQGTCNGPSLCLVCFLLYFFVFFRLVFVEAVDHAAWYAWPFVLPLSQPSFFFFFWIIDNIYFKDN